MSEVGRVEFQSASAELAERLNQTVKAFAAERGLRYDATSLMQQSGVDLSNTVNDVLMFGCDLWPSEVESTVVVPFKRPERLAKASRIGKVLLTTANAVGAIVATSLVAAATTETFSFPGLPVLAEAIYAKNTPERYTRIVESRGEYYRITLSRNPSEPYHIVHVVSEEPIANHELAALGVNTSADTKKLAGNLPAAPNPIP